MANRFFNTLTVRAEHRVISQIMSQVTPETLLAANCDTAVVHIYADRDEIRFQYETSDDRGIECIESLAQSFPDAYFLATICNANGSIHGFAAYAYGHELYGKMFEDCRRD